MNDKQFEIIKELQGFIKAANTRIAELQEELDRQRAEAKSKVLTMYDETVDVWYLVEFDTYLLQFYKVTREKVHEVKLSWYDFPSNKRGLVAYPTNVDEAMGALMWAFANPPTNCEIYSYQTFGYFHDIKQEWLRSDFVAEKFAANKIPIIITSDMFDMAIKAVADFYITKSTTQTHAESKN
jgi:hypothetical protein